MQNQPSQQQTASPGVTIVNGAPTAPSAASQGDHSRKPSVTITSAGTSGYMPNGGPASRPNSLQFGFANQQSSPNMGNPAVLASSQSQPSGLGVAPSMNPRVTSPQTSPSPIPQPASSGGRPPPSTYQGQGNVPNFGSFGDAGDANVSFFSLFFPLMGLVRDACVCEALGTRPRAICQVSTEFVFF
jgi:translation initiation factor 4G